MYVHEPYSYLQPVLPTYDTMENYTKGRNVEPVESREEVPLRGLPPDFVWMQVRAGTKMRNVVDYAIRAAEEEDAAVVFSGHGQALNKVISSAEIVKRK